jgi:hypothetical protein
VPVLLAALPLASAAVEEDPASAPAPAPDPEPEPEPVVPADAAVPVAEAPLEVADASNSNNYMRKREEITVICGGCLCCCSGSSEENSRCAANDTDRDLRVWASRYDLKLSRLGENTRVLIGIDGVESDAVVITNVQRMSER